MYNLKIIKKSDLTILETSKKGILILSPDDYLKFEFETRPFNLSALPILNGKKELIYEIKSTFRHSFSQSKKAVTTTKYFKILDIKVIKKYLKITDEEISKMFGYKNTNSYATSSAKKRIEKGLVAFYELINA